MNFLCQFEGRHQALIVGAQIITHYLVYTKR